MVLLCVGVADSLTVFPAHASSLSPSYLRTHTLLAPTTQPSETRKSSKIKRCINRRKVKKEKQLTRTKEKAGEEGRSSC